MDTDDVWHVASDDEWTQATHDWQGLPLCAWSPCGVRITVRNAFSLEATLLLMHQHRLGTPVLETLVRDDYTRRMDPRCLADFLIGYGQGDRLLSVLESSPTACDYVMQLRALLGRRLNVDDAEDALDWIVDDAAELARCVSVARAAREALDSL